MNRVTRLSLIAVMLLATTALGIISYKAMNPDMPPPPPEPDRPGPTEIIVLPPPTKPAEPRPNPVYMELQVNLERHQQHCLQLGSLQLEAVIVLDSKSQATFDQRVKECWGLVEIERKYVENFPAKTIQ